MTNFRKSIYNSDKSRIGIKVNKKIHWVKPDDMISTRRPGLYYMPIEGKNYYFGTPGDIAAGGALSQSQLSNSNLAKGLPPISFARQKTDLKMWREAIWEAERLPFQFRVYMQLILMDVIQNPFIRACWDRRVRLTVQKQGYILDDDGHAQENQPEFLKSEWWNKLLTFILQAQAYGYQLISLGDMINDAFPQIDIIPRQNISPDREVVATVVYNVGGKYFGAKDSNTFSINSSINPETGKPYSDSHIWVTTPTEIGGHFSRCGYGLFYYLTPLYFALRDISQFNLDFLQLHIEPIRWLQTDKTDKREREAMFESLLEMGRTMAMLTDKEDKLNLLTNSSIGSSFQAYADMEKRVKAEISVLLLGHENTMSGTPGKLGSQQKATGGDTPEEKALNEIENEQDQWLCHIINNNVFPKLKALGLKIPDGLYGYENNEEANSQLEQSNKMNLGFAQVIAQLKQAGYEVPGDYITEMTGIPVEEAEQNDDEQNNEIEDVTNFLNTLKKEYGHK